VFYKPGLEYNTPDFFFLSDIAHNRLILADRKANRKELSTHAEKRTIPNIVVDLGRLARSPAESLFVASLVPLLLKMKPTGYFLKLPAGCDSNLTEKIKKTPDILILERKGRA
jgi:hypothetical protein